jgi:hypothetical protein
MKTNSHHRVLVSLLAIGLSFAIAVSASAVEYPLSSTSIRDAYFLAKGNGENLGRFLLRYSHALPMPKSGPQVAVISLVTPFIQVLEHSAGTADYSAPSAVKQFSGKSLPLLIRVEINLTATYPAPASSNVQSLTQPIPDFYGDFDIQLVQGKKIPSESKHVSLVYSDASANIYGLAGAVVELGYDSEKIDTSEVATVVVRTPDGQDIEAPFNLAILR